MIRIDNSDIQVSYISIKSGDINLRIPQIALAHEFGHTIGNSAQAKIRQRVMHGDEYNSQSPYFMDKHSIMNIGNELRDRHLDYILLELSTMIPHVTFKHI